MSGIQRNIYYLYEIGSKRNQEDYLWPAAGTADVRDGIFIVCDGVGGSDNGEFASRFVAESVGKILTVTPFEQLSQKSINDILSLVQKQMIETVTQQSLNTDMATTFSLLVLKDDRAFIAWCGDSRVYYFSEGKIAFKTSDHSLVSSLVKNGEITDDEAAVHPQKNIILKAIKADESPIEAEVHHLEKIKDSDSFLLCTDGLLENIRDRELPQLIHHEPAEAIVAQFQQRCLGKTRDNYSMYLIKNQPVETKKKTKKLLAGLLLLTVLTTGLFMTYHLTAPKEKDNSGIPILLPSYDEEDTENDSLPPTPTGKTAPVKEAKNDIRTAKPDSNPLPTNNKR